MTHSSEIIQMVFFRSLVILFALLQDANQSCQTTEEALGPLRRDAPWLAQGHTRTVLFSCCLGCLFFPVHYLLCVLRSSSVSSQKVFGEFL